MDEKCLLSSRAISFPVMPTSYRENKVFDASSFRRSAVVGYAIKKLMKIAAVVVGLFVVVRPTL